MRYTWDISHRQRVTIYAEADMARLEMEVDGVLTTVSGSRAAFGRFLLLAVGIVAGVDAFEQANQIAQTMPTTMPVTPPTTTDA